LIKINVLLIDGDKAALSALEIMLASYEYLYLIGSYSDPNKALATLDSYPIDVIFLDLDMEFINGLDVAVRISRTYVNAEIVFMTEELHYAVEAFNLNAMDYLLKPIEQARLDQSIMKLLRRKEKRNFIKGGVK
jgi:two-component system LytT family response regulator